MKIIIYYLLLLLGIGLVAGFVLSQNANSMNMPTLLGISGLLILYAVILSLVGEGAARDEREQYHRHLASRSGLVTITAFLTVGVLTELFFYHRINFWLLAGLILINLSKLISLIYCSYKK